MGMRLQFTARCEGWRGVNGGLVASGLVAGAPDGAVGIGIGIEDWGVVAPPSTVILSGVKDLGTWSK